MIKVYLKDLWWGFSRAILTVSIIYASLAIIFYLVNLIKE